MGPVLVEANRDSVKAVYLEKSVSFEPSRSTKMNRRQICGIVLVLIASGLVNGLPVKEAAGVQNVEEANRKARQELENGRTMQICRKSRHKADRANDKRTVFQLIAHQHARLTTDRLYRKGRRSWGRVAATGLITRTACAGNTP